MFNFLANVLLGILIGAIIVKVLLCIWPLKDKDE